MAKAQYRVSGPLAWQSMSGNAVFALLNNLGSGSRIRIRSVEVTSLAATAVAAAAGLVAQLPFKLSLRGASSISGGDALTPLAMDTQGASWPSAVKILANPSATGSGSYRTFTTLKHQMAAVSATNCPHFATPSVKGRLGGWMRGARKDTSVQKITLAAGQGLALTVTNMNTAVPLRVYATFIRLGSPNRTFTVQFLTVAHILEQNILVIDNQAGSGESVQLAELAVEELGTLDSPFFQLVPVGTANPEFVADANSQISVVKMDTASADIPSTIKLVKNCPTLPYGVPEQAIAEGSTGTPKGYNYLQTKDFVGPVYRTFFPEVAPWRGGVAVLPDVFGTTVGQKRQRLLDQVSELTVREGEGLALVSAAESATIATAVGTSGWAPFEFGITFEVDNSITVTVTANTSLVGAEVRVYDLNGSAGSLGTGLAGVESCPTPSFSFDADAGNEVWIQIMLAGYREFGQKVVLPAVASTLLFTLEPELNS